MGLMWSDNWNSSFRKRIARSCTYPTPSHTTSLSKETILFLLLLTTYPTPSHCDCQATSLWRNSGWRTTFATFLCWWSNTWNIYFHMQFADDSSQLHMHTGSQAHLKSCLSSPLHDNNDHKPSKSKWSMIIDHLWTTWSLSEVANTVSCRENSVVFLIIVIIMIIKIIVI